MKRRFHLIRGRPGKRLKGLDEFEPPAFLGRMERIERTRKAGFALQIMIALIVGGAIGWLLS